jgi:hypothetical protein
MMGSFPNETDVDDRGRVVEAIHRKKSAVSKRARQGKIDRVSGTCWDIPGVLVWCADKKNIASATSARRGNGGVSGRIVGCTGKSDGDGCTAVQWRGLLRAWMFDIGLNDRARPIVFCLLHTYIIVSGPTDVTVSQSRGIGPGHPRSDSGSASLRNHGICH